ncbi:MAG: hypothetical protein ACK5X3_17370 [Pseudomonadota bacterium]|jgi:hypothetical protein
MTMTQESEREALLRDMRVSVVWTDKACMPIPLYERVKDFISSARLGKGEVESITKHPQWLALRKEEWEAEQILGKALGYPWYKDDQKNFPGCTESDGVCTGDHTLVTLAMEASRRIASLSAKPVEVGDTELAALVVEAFNKAEKPENHIGLCAGYRIAQAILSRYKAMVAWYARDHYNAGWQAATAAADAKYLPVIEKLVGAAGEYYNKYMLDEAESADNCTCGEQQHRDAIAVREALALAAPLLAEKRGV